MPEYLAPGVYVEEVDTGNKPIEGVSTSTSAVVGVTERGPVNVPILTTSFAEYNRWFGGYLNAEDFPDRDNQRPHRYLPHAVEGFFTNGGQRLFIVRVLDMVASNATMSLFDRETPGDPNPIATQLLYRVAAGTNRIYVVESAPGLSAISPPTVRIGDGSEAEYRQISGPPDPATRTDVSFRLPVTATHPSSATIDLIAKPTGGALQTALAEQAPPGVLQVRLNDITGLAPDNLLRIGTEDQDDEYIFVAAVNPVSFVVTLRHALQLLHAQNSAASLVDSTAAPIVANVNLERAIGAGDSLLFVSPATQQGNFTTPGNFVRINDGLDTEICRIGQLGTIALVSGAYVDYPVGAVVEAVNPSDDANSPDKAIASAVQAGSLVVAADNRQTLQPGDVVRIGGDIDPDQEYAVISSIPNPVPPPNAGTLVLNGPLRRAHVAGTVLRKQASPVPRFFPPSPTSLLFEAPRGSSILTISGSDNAFAQNKALIRILLAGDTEYYHRVASNPVNLSPVPVLLNTSLEFAHPGGAEVVNRRALLLVQALDAGAWGNRLRISVQDDKSSLVNTRIRAIIDPTRIRLSSASGVEAGTILQLTDAAGELVDLPFKVIGINRQADNLITLDSNAPLPATAVVGNSVRSLEFQMNVYLLRQPDPAVPLRSEAVLDTEVFRSLSMDSRHSRYVEKVIGTTWSAGATEDNGLPPRPLRLEDRRSEGESGYIRVRDFAQDFAEGPPAPSPYRVPTLESPRPGPEALMDLLPDGRQRPAFGYLQGGTDSVETITDDTYVGTDSPEPLQRTGLFSLRNEEELSIVACPGRTSATIQGALIDHCELMRYRFAVLDAQRPPNDSLNDVQAQRQQYDTKYAAIYHPWALIRDPFPINLAAIQDCPIPPSGHVMGIYARTDNERGVHKAPANEVVRGVIGLQRILNKGEQDILNPFPININVIRDFRPNNRGIRIWGGRVITSDPDWKYVNVRRLLIFIEASIDRGLQWVVFEPNAEPLWARVNRTISNFLTSVWRDGGLEGTKPEEAYFVKVDRTTMTQTDIDNGRLIVVIGVAPVKPAEFVIIRIGLWTAHADT